MIVNANVPIIGQPEVTDWFIALQVKCTCGQQFQLAGQVGSMRACPGQEQGKPCPKVYRISGLPVLQQDAQAGLAPIVTTPEGDSFFAGIAYGMMPSQP